MKTTNELVEAFVREFWKVNRLEDDVFISFEQKYSVDTDWEHITAIASPYYGDSNPETTIVFNFDFCEGETDLRNFMCVYLDDAAQAIRDMLDAARSE